ncbi:Myosin type-2 heavy chain 1 [Rhizopus stolonifer]|uniref:Myosin type-2 heavy chain 1 n=1 Tax=Rhizopus stolonifer TaxID=4846 RepID=A0A367KL87_RHIST|nr:Myosin type-2 heavy chain 1 [Rhizopus stolonifer]
MTESQIQVYSKGVQAWFIDKEEGWVSATCVSNTTQEDKVVLKFIDETEKEHVFEASLEEIKKAEGSNLPPLRNPPKIEYTDDLTNLSYLNEPSVLNTIKTRYIQHLIYTYSGIVLIAVNPFDRVSLYESDIVQQYSGKRRGELEPHLFAISEEAYRCMIREEKNQTIVVSGESGAGKTVSAKFIMRYFATADDQETTGKKKKDEGMTEVEEQILATNPIMEAFGNAKTTRNDNSSRFGKYIEIQFDGHANIVGAKIRTYLLERSRLIFQPETERNYHIFYQLCAGVPLKERKDFELSEFSNFHYLNQSGTGEIPGVDDKEEFEITQKALSTVGLSVDLQWKIFRLLAALLHLGNIQITGRNDAILSDTDPALLTATRLLGIKTEEFRKWIVRKQIVTRSEKIVTNLNPAQAHVVKDSVAKYIYSNLFDWLVGVVNESLSCPDENNVKNFIGVLDIYGFEHFKTNSFEQFCINYANEKLQQQFNQHVFKLEQEEYVREKINWTFIEFSDNQKCIEVIEGKLGILSLLDEESRLPAGTDQGFCQKLYDQFSAPEHKKYFKKPRFSNSAFTIAHYAHDVQYETENFLEKNKDSLPDEHLDLLKKAEFNFLEEILTLSLAAAQAAASTSENKRKSVIRKPTLGSIFKTSLINLMDTIGETNVHYIRCIKPNEAKVAWAFDGPMVLSQLRACGVLETIRISCLGYPSRWSFEEFAERYYALVPSSQWDTADIRSLCQRVLDNCMQNQDTYQVGETKIFFRAGQLALMEKKRSDRYDACATVLQKNMRRYVYRRRYLRTLELILQLQSLARQKAAQEKLQELRRYKAAVIIQKNFRRYVVQKEFKTKKTFILKLQKAIRGRQARQEYKVLRENHAAVQIQRYARGMLARKWYKTQIEHIILLQSCVRRRFARREFMTLRAEAKSADHFKEVSYQLENKVVELNQAMATLRIEKTQADQRTAQLESQLKQWSDKYERIEKESKVTSSSLKESQTSYEALEQEHTKIKTEHTSALEKIKRLTEETEKLKQDLAKEKTRVQKEVVREVSNETETNELKSQIVALKAQLARAMHTRKQDSLSPSRHGTSSRNVSPSPMRGRQASFSATEDPLRQTTLLTNRKTRRNSSVDVSSVGTKSSIDRIRLAEELSNGKAPRPTSLGIYNTSGNSALKKVSDDPESEINSILHQEETLQEEVLGGLVRSLKIPMPSTQNPPSNMEIMFPAHLIGLCARNMWRAGRHRQSENLLFAVMDAVQKQLLSFNGEDAIVPCAFWFTNIHELLSIITQAEPKFQRELYQGGHPVGWRELEKQIRDVKYEFQCLEDNIFHSLIKEIKKCYGKMVVPAIIESQSLPGFITNNSGKFLSRILMTSTTPAYNMDDLLTFLNKVHRTMTCYSIEPSVIQQVLGEVLKMTGTMSFNDLLMRKNFSSWKRAMQIQYNITRIEEWCKGHDIPESDLQLEHLTQATKLLQFKKSSLEDIENIYEICWILSPTQIQKLISQYHVADYESPVQPDILRAVAARVIAGNPSDVLLLDSVPFDDKDVRFEIPAPRETKDHLYLPAWMQLTRIRRLTVLEDALAEKRKQESGSPKTQVILEDPREL